MATNQNTKRKDKARVVLRKGESQRKDGKYDFRWTSPDGKRHSIYAATLEELREKEKDIQLDSLEGIKAEARYVTLNDVFTLWAKGKRGLKDNTFQNYLYLNRFGECQHQGTLNKAIRRIIRDCNDEVLAKNLNSTVLLPRFSCHTLRHTFTTRMCEAGVNIKAIQDALGHSDISTTLNICADVTKELRKSEFENLDRQYAQWKDPEE